MRDIPDPALTARRMRETYKESRYTAHERASDHAMAADNPDAKAFWLKVCEALRQLENKS